MKVLMGLGVFDELGMLALTYCSSLEMVKFGDLGHLKGPKGS